MIDKDFSEALYNQQKYWEREQEFYASESAKANADIEAQEESEMEELREKIAKIEFCKLNCNRLYSNCQHPTPGCRAVFLQEKVGNGWPFLLADKILFQVETWYKKAGYRKLSVTIPPVLSDEEIAEKIRAKVDNPVFWMNSWLIDFSTELRWVAQFQRDSDVRFYNG